MTRASHEITPFVIKRRQRDIFGKWGHWQVRSRHWCSEERDSEFLKLKNTDNLEFECVTDMAELDAQLRAMGKIRGT